MVKRFSVNGKALSSLTLDEIFSEIRKRDTTISPYAKKSILRNILKELLQKEENINNNNKKKRPLSDDDDTDNEIDDGNNIGSHYEKSLERLMLKFKNKRIKYEEEYSNKSQQIIKDLRNENSELKEKIEELNSDVEFYSHINKNKNCNNNNKNNNNNNINEKNQKCLKLYKKLIQEYKVNKILSKSLSKKKNETKLEIRVEFIKFMVIKVMENDLGVDFSPNKLLPSPSVHSFWKKMVLNSEWYKEFLRILGSDIHFKLSDKKDLKNPKLRLVLRKKYEHTLQIYSKYFPESSIIQLDKNNKESLWPFNYLLSPSEESDSELESPKKKNSPPITCIPMNISSTFFSSPSAHFSSSYSSSSSSIPMISNNSTPCASLESSPLGSPITSIVRSNSQAETIKIIVDSKTETLFYRVPIKQKFKEILKNFIERNPTLIYFYNDFEVSMLDTPKSLDMEHDDIIEGREEVKEPHQQLV